MDTETNHYEFLNLEMSASRDVVEAALQRLSDQAATLVYTSPRRSQELWDRVRQIRRDLLLDEERRIQYDRSLLEAPEERQQPIALITPALAAPPATGSAMGKGVFWSTLLGGAAAAVLIAFVALAAHRTPAPSPPLALAAMGTLHGSSYVSGQTVHLRWNPVPHAVVYRLQVAQAPLRSGDTAVFRHTSLTTLTNQTSYALKVVGAQFYYWRIQAYTQSSWTRYAHAKRFFVATPSLQRPSAIVATRLTVHRPSGKRLCWSGVKGAIGYRLRVSHLRTMTTTSTCTWVAAHAGSYTWSVAALIRGAQVYQSAYSRPMSFTIRSPRRHTRHRRPTRPVVVAAVFRATRSSSSHRTSSTTATGAAKSQQGSPSRAPAAPPGQSSIASAPVREPSSPAHGAPTATSPRKGSATGGGATHSTPKPSSGSGSKRPSPPAQPPRPPAIPLKVATAPPATAPARASAPPPVSYPTSAVPTQPVSAPPAPAGQHPAHPVHPAHPAHPEHPEHPAHPGHP